MKALASLALLLLLLAACDREDSASPAPSASSPASAPALASTPAPLPSANTAPPLRKPLEVLRMTLSSEVKKREPVDTLVAAEAGQRVWAHLAVRNRSDETRRITLRFSVNGEERSSIDLKVEPSWSYRTWGYNTLRASDKSGELDVEVRDFDDKSLLAEAKIPIQKAAIRK